jgi:hypothetical protein
MQLCDQLSNVCRVNSTCLLIELLAPEALHLVNNITRQRGWVLTSTEVSHASGSFSSFDDVDSISSKPDICELYHACYPSVSC